MSSFAQTAPASTNMDEALMTQYLQGLLPGYTISTSTGQLTPVTELGATGIVAIIGVIAVLYFMMRSPRTWK